MNMWPYFMGPGLPCELASYHPSQNCHKTSGTWEKKESNAMPHHKCHWCELGKIRITWCGILSYPCPGQTSMAPRRGLRPGISHARRVRQKTKKSSPGMISLGFGNCDLKQIITNRSMLGSLLKTNTWQLENRLNSWLNIVRGCKKTEGTFHHGRHQFSGLQTPTAWGTPGYLDSILKNYEEQHVLEPWSSNQTGSSFKRPRSLFSLCCWRFGRKVSMTYMRTGLGFRS